MAKERLSTLQKWLIYRTKFIGSINKKRMKGFFNKSSRDVPTNNERGLLYKSLSSPVQKELLTKDSYRNYILTEKGINVLKIDVAEEV
jgi:hypothetical protein